MLSTRELTDRWALAVRLGDQSLEPRWYSAAGVPAVYKRAAELVNYSDEGAREVVLSYEVVQLDRDLRAATTFLLLQLVS